MKKTILSVLCLCTALIAGEIAGNYYSDANRDIFLLPKSAAMAGADVAIGRSASPLSNPAALQNDSAKELSLAYAGYFQNTYSTSALSYIGPVDSRSSFGVSASYVLVPGIEMYDDTIIPANVPTRSCSDLLFRVSYARKLVQFMDQITLSAGAAINAERRNLVGWTGYGIGADAGLDFSWNLKEISSIASAGLLCENLTTSFTHWSSNYKEYAYPHVRFGLGWQQEIPYIYGRFCLSYLTPDLLTNEGINSTSQAPGIKSIADNPAMLFLGGKAGLEYTIMNTISFRVGVIDGPISFGGGLRLFHNRAGFDFAYLNHDLASTYKLSANYKWF
jgi:hypothetical protein